ncbi:hypothetical protein FEDK69T_10260 [Flavobacterium enshiense DK69]|nr:hypothetical protein FEDK69T_10260 [Flavobacterium enshiense DK69]
MLVLLVSDDMAEQIPSPPTQLLPRMSSSITFASVWAKESTGNNTVTHK